MAEQQKVNINTDNLKKQMPPTQTKPANPPADDVQAKADLIINEILKKWNDLAKKIQNITKYFKPQKVLYRLIYWLESRLRNLREKLEQSIK